MNAYLLLAALADLAAVFVHGVVGYRIMIMPLTPDRLFPTGAFGDADTSRRILVVAWHLTTAAFACSAIALSVPAFGVATSASVPQFVSALHASFLLVGLGVLGPRLERLFRPIPMAFVACMSTVALMGWLGSG